MHLARILPALACALVLTACNSVDGTLEVVRSFTYVNRASPAMIDFCRRHPTDYFCRDVDVNNATVTFQPGSYRTKLEFPSRSQVRLIADYPSGGNRQTTLSFKLPDGQSFPTYSGNVHIPASQLQQNYDLNGRVDTQESDSETMSGYESCTYYTSEHVCRWETITDPDGFTHQEYVCSWEQVPNYGQEAVEYHIHYTTTDFSVALHTPGTSELLSRFAGRTSDSRRVYTYRGPCN